MAEQNKPAAKRGMRSKPEKSSAHDKLDARLDEALKETFPASDPIAVTPPRARSPVRAPS